MEIYLQAQGTRVYRTVLTGWSPPTVQNADGTAEAKPIETWTGEEMTSSDLNNNALNSIVGSLHESVFTLVTGIKEAKRVCDTLETRYEGTSDVKQSKLQLVLSEFESLRMGEEETISIFHSRVQSLMNRASVLGEPFTDERVVKKILRSLSKRFRMKVTAIQEHSGWEKKSVGELMGSLHTYELEVLADDEPVTSRKGKSVAFVAEADRESDTDDVDDESLALLTKNFKKILKGFNRSSQGQPNRTQYKSGTSSYQKTETPSFSQNNQPQSGRTRQIRSNLTDTARPLNISMQCRECEGFGHIQSECSTYLKRKKAMPMATLSDDEEETVNKSLNDDLKQRDDQLKKLSTELFLKEDLITQIRSRDGKLIKELENIKKKIKMMDTTSTLDKILDSGRNPNDKKGLVFERGESSKKAPMFVREGTLVDRSFHDQSQSSQIKQKGIIHTGITEYQSDRFKVQSQYSRFKTKPRKGKYQNKSITPFVRQVWVRKSEVICYPTIVLPASMTATRWYFDNGCSRHMTGNVKCLMSIHPSSGSVTYGDGQKGKIVGNGTLNVPGLPHLDEVLLVRGLKANLISISQLCDQNWNVCFNRDCCRVSDKADQVVMEGTRSSDNCYVLTNKTACLI
ncbi:PREDICTED: uncharacterized protein LOC109160643 [Ipomoea nil]|uniref:uncharacterized protein LOC109160643 n=1 Tax=Ipomoea nil TaxID=35883 RepID=UPI000901326D|nr:PREDICTED: uncharacterized protein LOC109160643 [Ipomoea nil]